MHTCNTDDCKWWDADGKDLHKESFRNKNEMLKRNISATQKESEKPKKKLKKAKKKNMKRQQASSSSDSSDSG